MPVLIIFASADRIQQVLIRDAGIGIRDTGFEIRDLRFVIRDAGQIKDDLIPICFPEENVFIGDA